MRAAQHVAMGQSLPYPTRARELSPRFRHMHFRVRSQGSLKGLRLI
jgi:hypothetical protein